MCSAANRVAPSHSACSLMFWTNWNEQSPSIMRATLTGSNVIVIIGSDIRTPNGLAIDHRAEKLYFSDATLDKIERCEYDGTRRYVSQLNVQRTDIHFPRANESDCGSHRWC